jgi:predicted DNA-binding protein
MAGPMGRWEKKDRSLHIMLPSRLREALEAEAKRLDRNISYILMRMLEHRYADRGDTGGEG